MRMGINKSKLSLASSELLEDFLVAKHVAILEEELGAEEWRSLVDLQVLGLRNDKRGKGAG